MSPFFFVLLAGMAGVYLLVVLPLTRDENRLGRWVVVAPTLRGRVLGADGRPPGRAGELIRRWQRGWNGTQGEQRVPLALDGRFELAPQSLRSWAARVVPHEPITEQSLALRIGDQESVIWQGVHRTYDDHPLELRITL